MRSYLFLFRALSRKLLLTLFLLKVCWPFFVSLLLFNSSSTVADELHAPIGPDSIKVLRHTMPGFPPELIGAKMGDGEVVIVLTIDDLGKVNDSLVLEATNDAFANAATSAVNEWRFEPFSAIAAHSTAPDLTKSSPRREVLQFNFKRSGVVTTMSHADAARDGFVGTRGPALRTVPWGALDSEPQPINVNVPQLPSTSTKRDKTPLVINFVIDRKGQVRVPVILGSVEPALAEIVLAAVKTWRYTPPMQQKQAVAVEVTNALVLPDSSAE